MLARRIGELQIKKGLSQSQLAEMLHVSASTIGMYEQGHRSLQSASHPFGHLEGCDISKINILISYLFNKWGAVQFFMCLPLSYIFTLPEVLTCGKRTGRDE